MTPEFSILTPTYNCAGYVRRAYWAICQQTVEDWEWIVVDDGSTDDTRAILNSLSDRRIRTIYMDSNVGRGAARTCGLREARGRWLVLWDMDDLSFPDRLAAAREARRAGMEFMCSASLLVDQACYPRGIREAVTSGYPRTFVHATLCVDLSLARRIGYTSHRTGEDYTMMITLANRHTGAFLQEPLYIYFEERHQSPRKAFATHHSRLDQITQLTNRGVLSRTRELRRTIVSSHLKRLAALGLCVLPGVYRRTIALRSARRHFTLTAEQEAFLGQARALGCEASTHAATTG